MQKRIKMFATANDTQKFVVAVDGYIQGFESLDEANEVYGLIHPDCHFDNSGYGSAQILVPGHRPIDLFKKQAGEPCDMTEMLVSDVQQIDMRGYLTKHVKRWDARFKLDQIREYQNKPACQRLAEKREHDAIWGEIFG